MFTLLLACSQPLDLPEDLAAEGVPVGVQTLQARGQTFEIWYPTRDGEDQVETADILQFIPDAVQDRVGEVDLPPLTSGVRDAPLRRTGEPYPVVVFSHGFGGYRLQSLDLTTHWASRGYVVVSVDHPGRRMGDLLPCMFSPVLEGCDVAFEDPGPDDVEDVLDWLEEGGEAFDVDLDHIALAGHSAGGSTTATLGNEDERLVALLPLASPQSVSREVPTLLIAGSCDAYAPQADLLAAGEDLLLLHDTGHLAFADFCELDLGAFAQDLKGREDINETLLAQLEGLATDGCPGYAPQSPDCEVYFDLPASKDIIRYASTAFLDEHLRGEGPGAEDLWEETSLYE